MEPTHVQAQQRVRNLSLQPEALSMSRRLGNRFRPSSVDTTTSVGNLVLEGVQQPIEVVRRQTETGETVELQVGSRKLMWNEREGTKTASSVPTDTERLMVERLTLDSPDQFVLAQLRGASYFTVARNVRPADASEGGDGPLWNIVRIDEPQRDGTKPISNYRLYYLNERTGLIDKIVSELRGERIEVELTDWTDQSGEKVPGQISWTRKGQLVMQYRVTTFSHSQQPQ